MEGSLKAKTAESMDQYALIAETDRPLLLQSHNKNSAILGIVGLDTECPLSQHHLLNTDHFDW